MKNLLVVTTTGVLLSALGGFEPAHAALMILGTPVDEPTNFSIQFRVTNNKGSFTYDMKKYWSLQVDFTREGTTDVFNLIKGKHEKPVPDHPEDGGGFSDEFNTKVEVPQSTNFSFVFNNKPINHGEHKDIWAFKQVVNTVNGTDIPTIEVSASHHSVPEPSFVFSILAFGALGVGSVLKKLK